MIALNKTTVESSLPQ